VFRHGLRKKDSRQPTFCSFITVEVSELDINVCFYMNIEKEKQGRRKRNNGFKGFALPKVLV